MNALYWFAMVVGVGMYLFSVFAGVSGDTDFGADGDAHFDADHGADHHGVDGYRILSLRNATYFLFAFGVTGVLLTWLSNGTRGLITAVLAVASGGLGAALSSFVFGWLRKSESGDMPGDRNWIGAPATVVLPIPADGTGKVFVQRGGRTQEFLARPFDPSIGQSERWTSVLVLEIRDGIALVAPDELTLGEHRPSALDAPRPGAPGASTEN